MTRSNYLILAIVITMVTLGMIGLAGAYQDNRLAYWSRRQNAQSIQNGAELYEANCESCHGVRGEGIGELGPPLNDEHFFTDRLEELGWTATLEEYIAAIVANGRVVATRPLYAGDGVVVMTAWAQDYGGPLRDDEIKDVTTFVMNWEPTALGQIKLQELILPALDSGESDPDAGKEVFLSAGCADCHTVVGVSSGETGPELTHIASVATKRIPDYPAESYLRESFLIPNAYIVEGYKKNSGCGGVITEKQLNDLIAFLMTLE